jgi:small subunit ribosomal protein S2
MEAELAKLEFNLGGVRDMQRLPDAVFVTDLKTEEIAVHEAARLRIPIIGLVDTNCDPTPVDYVIPGNDDAIRSNELIIGTIGGAIEEGSSAWRVQEEKRIAEEMARRKKEEEERKKREEEEKVRREAEEAAKAEADARVKAEAEKAAAQQKAAPAKAAAPQPAGPVAGDAPPASPPEGSPSAPAGGDAPAKADAPAAVAATSAPEQPAEEKAAGDGPKNEGEAK